MAIFTIYCGNCGTSAGAHQNPQANDQVRCRKCGQTDSYAVMMETAQAYVADVYNRRANGLERRPSEMPDPDFRWVVGGLED